MSGVTSPDAIAFILLAYCTASVINSWEHLSMCECPIHVWLLGTSVFVLLFRAAFYIGHHAAYDSAKASTSQSLPWYVSRPNPAAQAIFAATGLALLPSLALWTLLGLQWFSTVISDSPQCLPTDRIPSTAFVTFCLALCCLTVLFYMAFALNAWTLGRSLAVGAASLLAIQDEDLVSRWGNQQVMQDTDLHGLTTEELAGLPCKIVDKCDMGDCVICLEALAKGDKVRQLPGCGHCFHRPCVDLWLLRHTTCPLCKEEVICCDGEV